MKTYTIDFTAKPSSDLDYHLVYINDFFAEPPRPSLAAAVSSGYWQDRDYAVYFRLDSLAATFGALRPNRQLLRAILVVLDGSESLEELPSGEAYRYWYLPFRAPAPARAPKK